MRIKRLLLNAIVPYFELVICPASPLRVFSHRECAASLCARFRAARIQLGLFVQWKWTEAAHNDCVARRIFHLRFMPFNAQNWSWAYVWNSKPFILIGRATHSIHLFVSAGFYAQISQDNIKWKSLPSKSLAAIHCFLICEAPQWFAHFSLYLFLCAFSVHFSDMQIYFLNSLLYRREVVLSVISIILRATLLKLNFLVAK